MKYLRALALLSLPVLLLRASDSKWMEKDHTQWSSAEANRVLQDSPWARQAAAFIGTLDEDAREFPVKSPTARDAGLGGRQVSDGNWDGGVGRLPRGGNPTLPVVVRWNSALPVREALLRTHSQGVQDTEHSLAEPDKFYIISVQGLVRARQDAQPEADSAEGPPNGGRVPFDINQIRQGLMNQSRLYPKNQKGIIPEDISINDATGEVLIYFPKTVPLDLKDKEVTFQTSYGSVKVTQRFKLKDMLYHGKLEL